VPEPGSWRVAHTLQFPAKSWVTRGSIDVVTPAAFVHRFGVKAPDTARRARLAALRFQVADASLMQAASELAGLAGLYAGNPAVIGPEDAMGAVLVFEPASA
jgi:hypothetical protein